MTEVAHLELRPMVVGDVDEVHVLECSVFPHPWSRANFMDSLASGYDAWVLRAPAGALAGYFLLMYALDEAHLLDVAVAAPLHGRGVGRYLLDRIAARSRAERMASILLEVRPSNTSAIALYHSEGFNEIGRRPRYYPAAAGREDALVMAMELVDEDIVRMPPL